VAATPGAGLSAAVQCKEDAEMAKIDGRQHLVLQWLSGLDLLGADTAARILTIRNRSAAK
jgi:hypothetical protein